MLNSFPVIRTASAKSRSFHVPQPTFLFLLETRLRLSAICCMDGKIVQCLSNPWHMYPSIFNSFPVIRTASAKNRRFHVPQPTFLFPLETPLQLSPNMFNGWKDNSMLAKPFAACTYLCSIVSELYDALSQCVSPKIAILPHFGFPWGRPWGNNGKCCMDGKRIQCLQIVSLHVSV